MSATAERWWQRHAVSLRVVVGCVVGLAIVIVLLRVRSEAHRSAGVLDSLRAADRRELALAIVLEAVSYVLPGLVLRRLLPGLRSADALQIAVASMGVGPLLPANPVSGSGIAYAELRRSGATSARAWPAAILLVIGIPAAAMAVLAGPTLIASGLAAPLPEGWKGVVLVAGALAIGLAAALAAAVARGPGPDRAGRVLGTVGGRRNALVVLSLGAAAPACDAGCLWLTGEALHAGLPLSSLPMAYVAGVAIMALPLLPGGLGAVEVSLPAIFAAGGASYAAAVLAVLAWRLVSFWLPTVAGGLALAWRHRPSA